MRTLSNFQGLLDVAGLEPQAYSGRGMMGRDCLGVPYPLAKVVSTVLNETRDFIDENDPARTDLDAMFKIMTDMSEAFADVRTDAFGHGQITYWPGVSFDQEIEVTDDPDPASEYVAIAMWGQNLLSHAYYIEAEQAKAAEMRAPIDALYERDGKWVCVSDLDPNHEFRVAYESAMKERSLKGSTL